MSLIGAIERVRAGFAQQAPPTPDLPAADHHILLVYLFAGIGDAALLAPAIKALTSRQPRLPIGLLVRPLAGRLLSRLDLPVRIHTLPEALVGQARAPRGYATQRRDLEAAIESAGYTAAVDLTLRDGIDARRWLGVSKAPYRFGWLRHDETVSQSGLTWGCPDARLAVDRHWSRCCVQPLRPFGVVEPDPDVLWRSGARAEQLAAERWGDGPRVLLVPGAQGADKRWAPEAFAEVGAAATSHCGASIIVVGAPSERSLVKSIARASGPCARTFTGKDLATLIAIIRSADVVLTNDTGPMHIAFMHDIATVAVFTHMSPVSWGPLTPRDKHVILTAGSAPAHIVALAKQAVLSRCAA